MLPPSHDTKKKDILLGLHWAATTGNVGLIKFALDHGVPIDSVVNGFVPLQLACINDNNIAAVQYLIDRGADVNIQKWSKKYSVDKAEAVPGATGSTALHVACANGCIKIVDLLLRNNARVDVKDKYGSTPLDVAHAKNEIDIIKLLKKKQQPNDNVKMSRSRKPSLPSIYENNHHQVLPNIHSLISMTPATTHGRSLPTHRPSTEDMHTRSCPATPRTSIDYYKQITRTTPMRDRSPRTSEDFSSTILSSSPQSSILSNKDWYGYGVVNSYDDDNYLLSLERRAYNLQSNEHGELERHSQELKRDRRISTGSFSTERHNSIDSNETGYEGDEYDEEEEDDTSSESRPSMSGESSTKKKWFSQSVENITRKSLDLRPNLDHLTQFAKRAHIKSNDEESSDDEQKSGFFSRWAPTWTRKSQRSYE